MRLLSSLLLSGFCLTFSAAPGAAQLRDLRLWDSPEGTRVVFELDAAAAHKVFTLADPPRIVIDLPDTQGHKLASAVSGRGLVKQVRAAEREDGGLRVVLDMASAVEPRTVLLDPSSEYGHRLILDLDGAAKTGTTAEPEFGAAETPAAAPAAAAREGSWTPRPIIIAIDAGHGGEDPGARGHGGLLEKQVALSVSRKLAKLIDATPGFKAVLTRDGDYYLALRERTRRARAAQADLFVSIHANALHKRHIRGAAVYVVSPRGATSEHARVLAQRENAADLVGGIEIEDKDDELAAVLIDLSQSSTREASFDVGARMLKSLGRINILQKSEVQQAGFMVLKSPDIPSVLVETAFITNAEEEKLLGSAGYQEKLARSLLDGIKGYFDGYRPREQRPDGPRLQKVRNPPAQERRSAN